jgi:hypothetical protein
MPTVSVVIPTHNRSQYLRQAVDSVLAQSYADFEVIVVDDGSSDDTRAIVCGFTDARVRYSYQSNAGRCAARNAGIQLARGDYVSFLDDDDLFLCNKLSSHVRALGEHPDVGLVTGGWRCIDAQGALLKEVPAWLWHPRLDVDTWLQVCPSLPSAVTMRRTWLERSGGFDRQIGEYAEDWDLWLRLAYAGCQMAWVEELACAYRIHSLNTVSNASRQVAGMFAVLDKFYGQPDLPAQIRVERDSIYARANVRGAARTYAAGLLSEASQHVARAIESNPELLANNGEQLYEGLVAWTADASVGDPVAFVRRVFDNLPEVASCLRVRRHTASAQAAKNALFDAYVHRDWPAVRRNLLQVACGDARLLADRGVVKVAFEVLLVTPLVSGLRHLRARNAGRLNSSQI